MVAGTLAEVHLKQATSKEMTCNGLREVTWAGVWREPGVTGVVAFSKPKEYMLGEKLSWH